MLAIPESYSAHHASSNEYALLIIGCKTLNRLMQFSARLILPVLAVFKLDKSLRSWLNMPSKLLLMSKHLEELFVL